jgi:hypothetical protein
VRSVQVTAPGDVPWTVRVVWMPRWRALATRFGGWRRRRKSDDDLGDPADIAGRVVDAASTARPGSGGSADAGDGGGGGDFDLGDALIVIAVLFVVFIAAAALFWWVLLPVLLVLLDLLLVLILLLVAIVARVLFRRPWTVEAVSAGGERFTRTPA